MRLYVKLAVMLFLAFAGQALLSNGAVSDLYFATRCYIANTSGNRALEHRLVSECQQQFAAENSRAIITVASNASGPR